MSNKHTSHKHGMKLANALRPKSKLSKRRNKALAKDRKAVLLEALEKAKAAHK